MSHMAIAFLLSAQVHNMVCHKDWAGAHHSWQHTERILLEQHVNQGQPHHAPRSPGSRPPRAAARTAPVPRHAACLRHEGAAGQLMQLDRVTGSSNMQRPECHQLQHAVHTTHVDGYQLPATRHMALKCVQPSPAPRHTPASLTHGNRGQPHHQRGQCEGDEGGGECDLAAAPAVLARGRDGGRHGRQEDEACIMGV